MLMIPKPVVFTNRESGARTDFRKVPRFLHLAVTKTINMLAIKFSIRTQAHKYLPVIVSVNIFLCEESFLFFTGYFSSLITI